MANISYTTRWTQWLDFNWRICKQLRDHVTEHTKADEDSHSHTNEGLQDNLMLHYCTGVEWKRWFSICPWACVVWVRNYKPLGSVVQHGDNPPGTKQNLYGDRPVLPVPFLSISLIKPFMRKKNCGVSSCQTRQDPHKLHRRRQCSVWAQQSRIVRSAHVAVAVTSTLPRTGVTRQRMFATVLTSLKVLSCERTTIHISCTFNITWQRKNCYSGRLDRTRNSNAHREFLAGDFGTILFLR